MKYVWIVEMLIGKKWEPTVGVGLNRDHAHGKLRHWRSACPDDKFRLAKYVKEGKP